MLTFNVRKNTPHKREIKTAIQVAVMRNIYFKNI